MEKNGNNSAISLSLSQTHRATHTFSGAGSITAGRRGGVVFFFQTVLGETGGGNQSRVDNEILTHFIHRHTHTVHLTLTTACVCVSVLVC